MKYSEHTPLMHAVLDGEATPGESAELTRLLASDPAAHAEFEDLQRLFEGLKGVPQPFPPEGLVYSVMAGLPAYGSQRRARFGGVRQLFSRSRVLATTGEHSTEAPGTFSGKSATVHPISQRGPHFRGEKNMSEQNTSSVGNRKIWIGAGVAAAAVIVAVSTGVLPPSGKDTAGTIVPAQRYQAAQPTAADVKLGNPSSAAVCSSGATRRLAQHKAGCRAAQEQRATAASRATSTAASRATSTAASRATSTASATSQRRQRRNEQRRTRRLKQPASTAASRATSTAASRATSTAASRSNVDSGVKSSVEQRRQEQRRQRRQEQRRQRRPEQRQQRAKEPASTAAQAAASNSGASSDANSGSQEQRRQRASRATSTAALSQ